VEALERSYRILFRQQRGVGEAVARMRESFPNLPRSSTRALRRDLDPRADTLR
jgi:hypothetical protein